MNLIVKCYQILITIMSVIKKSPSTWCLIILDWFINYSIHTYHEFQIFKYTRSDMQSFKYTHVHSHTHSEMVYHLLAYSSWMLGRLALYVVFGLVTICWVCSYFMKLHEVTDLIDGIGCTGRETCSERSHQKSDRVKGHWSQSKASSCRSDHKSCGLQVRSEVTRFSWNGYLSYYKKNNKKKYSEDISGILITYIILSFKKNESFQRDENCQSTSWAKTIFLTDYTVWLTIGKQLNIKK